MSRPFNPNMAVITESGSKYTIDEQNKLFMGGKFNQPIPYLAHTPIEKNRRLKFKLDDYGNCINTSPVMDVAYKPIDKVNPNQSIDYNVAIFNPNMLLITDSGTQYSVDEEHHLFRGGEYGITPYASHSPFLKGSRISFDFYDGTGISTSPLAHSYSSRAVINQNQQNSPMFTGIYVCQTRTGSEYFVNMNNMTIAGGCFDKNWQRIINQDFSIQRNMPMKIYTEQGVIRTSPVTNVMTYDDYLKNQNYSYNMNNSMDYGNDDREIY